jgi:hypothetical protein
MRAMLLAATILAALSLGALAQPAPPGAAIPSTNLDRLRGMQTTSTSLELPRRIAFGPSCHQGCRA